MNGSTACSTVRRCGIDGLAIFAMIPLFPPEYSYLQEANIDEHEQTAFAWLAVRSCACAGRRYRTRIRTSEGTAGVCRGQLEECARRHCSAMAARERQKGHHLVCRLLLANKTNQARHA